MFVTILEQNGQARVELHTLSDFFFSPANVVDDFFSSNFDMLIWMNKDAGKPWLYFKLAVQ